MTDTPTEPIKKKGLVLCNVGKGKGKTTAMFGIAVRASGAGLNVYILQFVKAKGELGGDRKKGEWPVSSEIEFFNAFEKMREAESQNSTAHSPYLDKEGNSTTNPTDDTPAFVSRNPQLGYIKTEICGLGFVGILGDQKEKDEHKRAAQEGLARTFEILNDTQNQVVILDEILSAVELGLLSEDDVVSVIQKKPLYTHLLLTGHDDFPKVFELCDTVTRMDVVKHAYYNNIWAQKGVDY